MTIGLELPWPPTINTYRQPVRMGKVTRLVPSNKAHKFYKQAEKILLTQDYTLWNEEIGVELKLYPPDKRKRDIDNYIKPILDALTKNNVIEDDILIKRLTVYMCKKEKFGKVMINIYKLDDMI